MFPIFRHINDLLPHIQNKPEIAIKEQPNGTTVVCYAIADKDTFDSAFARECRGITFDSNGNILIRPLHKFFNIGENESTQVHNVDWSKMKRVMDKRDGSMITTAVINGKVVCKTKKTFDSAQADRALAFINANANFHQFAVYCAQTNQTPIFEWTSPKDRIVLGYPNDELVLLHIRDNITGEYALDLRSRTSFFKIPLVEDVTPFFFDIDYLIRKSQKEEHKEGYIIQFQNGDMVKLKTPWYLNLHHSVTFTRERDIAEMVVKESIDDFKSYLSSIGESLEKVHQIEDRVFNQIRMIKGEVEGFVKQNYSDDRKSFAIRAKTHPRFGLIMQAYLNKDPNYNEYFLKYHLSEFSLETV